MTGDANVERQKGNEMSGQVCMAPGMRKSGARCSGCREQMRPGFPGGRASGEFANTWAGLAGVV